MEKTEKKDQETQAELFLKEYAELCKKYKMELAAEPALKRSLDTGAYSTIVQFRLQPYEPKAD